MILGQERERLCSLRNPSAVSWGVCPGTGPGMAFTLASLKAGPGGRRGWSLVSPSRLGEEPSGKGKGKDLDFEGQGPAKGGTYNLGGTKMIFWDAGRNLDFLLYMLLILCLKMYMFVYHDEWSFFPLSSWWCIGSKKLADHCTKICQLRWGGRLVRLIVCSTPNSCQWACRRRLVNRF